MQNDHIILGIDPGTQILGYAVLSVQGHLTQVLEMDVLNLKGQRNIYKRLEMIYRKVSELVDQYHPDCFAIEAPFFGKNVQSMLKLGRAQGVAIAAAMHVNLPVQEYSPRKVKQAVTGNGNASKEQVSRMLGQILHVKDKPVFFDASDALAVALCHYYQLSSPLSSAGGQFSGWNDFIKKNADRIA